MTLGDRKWIEKSHGRDTIRKMRPKLLDYIRHFRHCYIVTLGCLVNFHGTAESESAILQLD